MARRVSTAGTLEILAHEAIVKRRYKDSVGVWTVGVGHTASAGPPDPAKIVEDLPIRDLIVIFRRDLARFEARVDRAVKVPLAQHEFDALVSFDFNTGGIERASLVKKLNAGDRAGAAKGFMAWRKPGAVIPRRQKEQKLFRDGVYSGHGIVSVYPASDSGQVLWAKGKHINARSLLAPRTPTDAELDGAMHEAAEQVSARNQAAKLAGVGELVKSVQTWLAEVGYPEIGDADGRIGTRTRAAILGYRNDRGLPLSDKIDEQLVSDLHMASAQAWRRPGQEDRALRPAKEIAAKSKTMKSSRWGKILLALGLGGGGAGNMLKDWLDPNQVDAHLNTAQRLLGFVGDNWLLFVGLAVAGVGGYVAFRFVEHYRVSDERAGRHFATASRDAIAEAGARARAGSGL